MRVRPAIVLALAAIAALVVCSAAVAKVRIVIAASDSTPARGAPVTVVVRTDRALAHDLRLIAVAPGRSIFRVVATITGDTSSPMRDVERHGFEIPLVRTAPNRWRGTARFTSPGRWRVVVPNGAPMGVIFPSGAAVRVLVVH